MGLFFIYGFDEILWLRPQSIHQWRQTDCLQMAHNYLTESWNLFSPSIHNYFSDGETSGKTAGEFTILYYFVAALWKVFGEHEVIFRIVTIGIFFIGLFALHDLLKKILNDNYWALAIPFFLFTSPLLIFYSNNFLTNVPAFCSVLIGWNFFYQYYSGKQIKYLYIAAGFFTLGGLLKVTAYISFIALGGIYFFDFLKKHVLKKEMRIFPVLKLGLPPFLISLLLVASWYLYVTYFTGIHGGKHTFNGIWPIWKMTYEEFIGIKKFITEIIIHQVFSIYSLCLLLGLCALLLIDFKKLNKFILAMLLLLIIGGLSFLLLWFQALEHHDYYVINLIILPLFVLIGFVWHLKDNYPKIFNSKITKILFSIFLAYNVAYAANNIRMRYWSVFNPSGKITGMFAEKPEIDFWWWTGNDDSLKALNDIEAYNRSLGIKKEDLVAYIPDQSFGVSLYLINQKGWTSGFGIGNFTDHNSAEKLKDKIDNKKLRYLFVGDATILDNKYLKSFLAHPIGSYKGVTIFSLQKSELSPL